MCKSATVLCFCSDSLSGDTLLSSLVIELSKRSNSPAAFLPQKSLVTAGLYSDTSGLLSQFRNIAVWNWLTSWSKVRSAKYNVQLYMVTKKKLFLLQSKCQTFVLLWMNTPSLNAIFKFNERPILKFFALGVYAKGSLFRQLFEECCTIPVCLTSCL